MQAKFKPRSLDPSALEATAYTLESLHRAGKVVRDSEGKILVEDGWIEMTADALQMPLEAYLAVDLKYVVWASVRQGYVEAAE